MSSTPAVPPFRLNLEKPPSARFKCPVCEAEDFPVMLLNKIVSVKYAAGKEVGELSALRTISGCGQCHSVISIQFIPVDIQVPVAGRPGEPA